MREFVHEGKCEIIEEVKALGNKVGEALGDRAARVSREDQFALRELIHNALTADEIRALLLTKGITRPGERKSALANSAALCFSAAEVQEHLSTNSGRLDRDRPAGTHTTKRKRGHEQRGSVQTTLPVIKKSRCVDERPRDRG